MGPLGVKLKIWILSFHRYLIIQFWPSGLDTVTQWNMVVFSIFSDFISATRLSCKNFFWKLSQLKTNHPRDLKPMPNDYKCSKFSSELRSTSVSYVICWWDIEELVMAPVCKWQKTSYMSISWAVPGRLIVVLTKSNKVFAKIIPMLFPGKCFSRVGYLVPYGPGSNQQLYFL